jgi:predicted metal-dependent phosphoesterase TrpH
LQVHTDASPCSRASPEDIVEAAVDAELDGLAITNHDTLEGYDAVNALAPESLTVIPGVEVTTTQGHLLALDVTEVPPQADPLTVIHAIHEQEGLAVLSHPFDKLREYYTDNLDRIAAHIDGVEVLNSRCIVPHYNRNARSFAEQHDLSLTGGSDAHFPMEVGRAYTKCDGPVLDAIREDSTETGGRGGYLSGHIATKLNDALTCLNI